jgi:amino-acid N-acetyltransferase
MKNNEMQLSFAALTDEIKIKGFLERNDLLHQDITPSHCDNFLLLSDGSKLIGTVGLEIEGHCALLRSLAVEELYRKKGLASQLLYKIEQHAKSCNVNTLYLLTADMKKLGEIRRLHQFKKQKNLRGFVLIRRCAW